MSMTERRGEAYPSIVSVYRKRYDDMATFEYRQKLGDYARFVLHDPFEGLNWQELLEWEHRHFEYTKDELPKPRAEMPIAIIQQAKGRCGEFALLYNGLTLANGYQSRIVIDCSMLNDKSRQAAGDHVWVEVLIAGAWVHVDPTEKRFGRPLMYAGEWSKDVNLVYAISEKDIVDVTKAYAARE